MYRAHTSEVVTVCAVPHPLEATVHDFTTDEVLHHWKDSRAKGGGSEIVWKLAHDKKVYVVGG